MRRRTKQTWILTTSVLLTAGVLSAADSARAATTAAAGIPITIENSGKCMNVSGASTDDGAQVIQYTCVPTAANDKWAIVPQGNDLFQIQSVGSGKCLTVLNASTANSASLIQYRCTTGGNELWQIQSQPARPTLRLVSAGSGKCLNVPGSSTDNNVNLIQYTCQAGDGTTNERLTIPPAASAAVTHRPFTSKQPVAVLQGGDSAGGGTAPVSYSWIGGDNQLTIITDHNPDVLRPDPNAPGPSYTVTNGYGYTGQPITAQLSDGRLQVVAHEAAAGDVHYRDELGAGSGDFDAIRDLSAPMAAQPTVGPYAPGRLAFYAVIDGALWYDPQAAGDSTWSIGGWRSLGGTGLTGVPASSPTTTGAAVFAANTTGQIQTATLDGTTLSDWTSLGGAGLGDPDVLPLPGNLALITARASDGSISYKMQNSDGGWPAAWTTIPGVTAAGKPSAVIGSADGRVDIAVRGTDNLVYLTQETAPSSGQFGGWIQASDPDDLPGTVADSDPTAFAYDVPSGRSFGVAFQNADTDTLGPYVMNFDPGWTAEPAATSVARATAARAGIHFKTIKPPAS